MEQAAKILQQIDKDRERAEQYLLTGATDKSVFSRAVRIIEGELTPEGKCLLDSRRELEKNRKYKSRRHWVIKTQFLYGKLAEERKLACVWLSESKIKRQWRWQVETVAEIAIRLDK